MRATVKSRQAFVKTRRSRARIGLFVNFVMWLLVFLMYIIPKIHENEIAFLVLLPLSMITVAFFISAWLVWQIYETTALYPDEVAVKDL